MIPITLIWRPGFQAWIDAEPIEPRLTGLSDHMTDHPASAASQDLRHNDQTGLVAKTLSALFMIAALVLLALGLYRIATQTSLSPVACLAIAITGWLLADFFSGLLHWAADSWGHIDMPVIGRRLLHPFRVHHVNPKDILARGFLDLNGDVAAVCLPFLALALWLPLDGPVKQSLVMLLMGTAGFALPTNQIHQWAHMPNPPRGVRSLQSLRLVLTRRGHARHHANPAGGHYCITTGWCNALLTRSGFYTALEHGITAITGCKPRSDPAMQGGVWVSSDPIAVNSTDAAMRLRQLEGE